MRLCVSDAGSLWWLVLCSKEALQRQLESQNQQLADQVEERVARVSALDKIIEQHTPLVLENSEGSEGNRHCS